MKRQIAAVTVLLAALGGAVQVQAQDWGADRPHPGNERHDQQYHQRGGHEDWRDHGHYRPYGYYRPYQYYRPYEYYGPYGYYRPNGYYRPYGHYGYYERNDCCYGSDFSLVISVPLRF